MPAFTFESAVGHFSFKHISAALLSVLASIYASQVVRFQRRSAINTLNDLSDRQLADIGLNRADIEAAVESTIR